MEPDATVGLVCSFGLVGVMTPAGASNMQGRAGKNKGEEGKQH
jgi:hypothetical protein